MSYLIIDIVIEEEKEKVKKLSYILVDKETFIQSKELGQHFGETSMIIKPRNLVNSSLSGCLFESGNYVCLSQN